MNPQKPRKTPGRARNNRQDSAARRTYDSPLRRQQAAETRDRIIAAGAEIAHSLPAWDWSAMTFKAVGERAGVSERTVHRHLGSERQLRDAVLQRLVEESGIRLDRLELHNFADIATQLYRYLSSFQAAPASADTDPSFAALDAQRRQVLVAVVTQSVPDWSAADREIAAATLDLLWNPAVHARLGSGWKFDTEQASRTLHWIFELVEQAIRQNHRPPRQPSARR